MSSKVRRTDAAMQGQISCCAFDLETTNLNADFGIVLCGVVLPSGGKPIIFRGDRYKTWKTKRSDDSGVVTDIVRELSKYDIWIAHNGARFDVPYLRTRLMKWRLPFLPNKKLLDPVWLARNKLRMSFNSLAQLASFLGVPEAKTPVDGDKWLAASLDGDTKAMGYIVEHCVKDVLTLETVVGAIKGYNTQLNSWGSGY